MVAGAYNTDNVRNRCAWISVSQLPEWRSAGGSAVGKDITYYDKTQIFCKNSN